MPQRSDAARAWRLRRRGGLVWIECRPLRSAPGVAHAFSTRIGPRPGDADLAGAGGAGPERRRLCRAAGLPMPAESRQVHGASVLRAGRDTLRDHEPEGDAWIALRAEWADASIAVRWADCVPLLIADRRGRAVAAAHAGWRGTVAGVAPRVVGALAAHGVGPDELIVALGPAIGGCCYTVGTDVLEAVAGAAGTAPERIGERGRLDLRRAVHLQLLAAGVAPAAIHVAPWCTACAGELFFSHRRQGAGAGRQIACIGWPAAAA